MKTRILIFTAIIASIISCTPSPAAIPEGTWNYDLLINGVKTGRAVFSNTLTGDRYVSRSEMYLNMGTIENKSVQIITETKDFKPVKLETYNTVTDTSTGSKDEINKTATFNGKEVTLISGKDETRITLDEDFILDGNFFFNELLRTGFKTGAKVTGHIYEPSVETDSPILVIVEVMGMENVKINGAEMKLLHIKERVEKLKSMDTYLDKTGIMEKVVIKMLNNVFELERVH